MAEDLVTAMVAFRRKEVLQIIDDRLKSGEDPYALLDECRRGITTVGEKFQSGEYFLAELILAGETFKKAAEQLKPHMERSHKQRIHGKIVLASLRGDIHDLGKNILATLLRAHGFEVHDLGVDVAPETLVEKVREIQPDFVGFSVLITTAFLNMKETADLLVQKNLRAGLKLMIGGGVTTPSLKEYIGADFQSTDAMEGVHYCLENANHRGGEHGA